MPQLASPETEDPILKRFGSKPEISPYAKPGPYFTNLTPAEEPRFQDWAKTNQIPWQDSPTADYDMRGFFRDKKAVAEREARIRSGGSNHFPDTYKTPYHQTFSKESRYATEDAPHWEGNRLIDKSGTVIADETPTGADAILKRFGTQAPPPLKWGDVLKAGAGAVLQSGKEIGTGALKGLGHSLSNIGDAATLGLTHLIDTPEKQKQREDLFRPKTPMESAGKTAEQAAEFFAPIPGVSKIQAPLDAGKALRMGAAGLRTAADVGIKTGIQTGNPKEAAATAAIAGPVGGVAEVSVPYISDLLKSAAVQTYGKVLQPLGTKAKEIGQKLVPEVLDRGYSSAASTVKSLNQKFSERVANFGKQLDDEYARLDATTRVKMEPIYRDFTKWLHEEAFVQVDQATNGTPILRLKDPKLLEAGLEKLQYVQDTLGPIMGDARPSAVREIRQYLDDHVFKDGLTPDESVAAANRVNRAMANGIRSVLNGSFPTIDKLDHEFHLWQKMAELTKRNITNKFGQVEFARRTWFIGHATAGMLAGGGAYASGERDPYKVAGWGLAGGLLGEAMVSTGWRSVSAVTKNKIADLLAKGNGKSAADLAARATGITAQATNSGSQTPVQ